MSGGKCIVRLQTVDQTTHAFVISADGTLQPEYVDNYKMFTELSEVEKSFEEIRDSLITTSSDGRPYYIGINIEIKPV